MSKIIISESQLKRLKERLLEDIHPSEAYNNNNSIQTVVDGKRGVGFIGGVNQLDFNKLVATGLKIIKIGMNRAYVFYREGYEEQAMQLAKIARKNGGYLPVDLPEETYVIGILLGYDKNEVKKFVLRHFPHFKFY